MPKWLKAIIDIITYGRGQGWWNKSNTIPKK